MSQRFTTVGLKEEREEMHGSIDDNIAIRAVKDTIISSSSRSWQSTRTPFNRKCSREVSPYAERRQSHHRRGIRAASSKRRGVSFPQPRTGLTHRAFQQPLAALSFGPSRPPPPSIRDVRREQSVEGFADLKMSLELWNFGEIKSLTPCNTKHVKRSALFKLFGR
ncbi:hypothetical protein MPH_05072 [Macrophomina phaseolina MS6]|uniref:Uncharacterized protein n=1 Tax=Macrophomina phaseolina (strain MS6) TaxID=1126212 RepID=K2S524_MACPH|nr:hypothetical protein MPH_05072 [Macrophomina phaseolina MS6]